jgi:ornithine carbamoyltransferase
LISLADLSDDELYAIVERGAALAAGRETHAGGLRDSVIGIYFRKTSTRTRTAFSAAALRLGARIISYGPDDLQENTGESVDDTGRTLSRMLDALVARTAASPEELRAFGSQTRMAVINAMTEDEHPTQALADLSTMRNRFGDLGGLRLLYIGEGNNTAAAMALALPRFSGTELYLRTPPGYGLNRSKLDLALRYAGGGSSVVDHGHDLGRLPAEVDVVYTTRWETTGTSKPDPGWRDRFAPFRVSTELMSRYPGAVFMHDLPAHRGQDVDAEVIDGPASIVFDQAESKMYSAMAVLEFSLA